MKTYKLTLAAAIKHIPKNVDRTAKRPGTQWDIEYKEWPNRAAMAKAIRKQEENAPNMSRDWVAVIPLTDGEGY